MLADLARTDAHNHRPVTGDSELAEAVKSLTRAHQSLIWTRQRQTNQLRSALREFYPGALEAFDDLDGRDALAVLTVSPTPDRGKALSRSKIAAALRRGGRQRNVEPRTVAIQAALRTEQLTAPAVVTDAMGTIVISLMKVIGELNVQIDQLETALAERFDQHPDAKIVRSLPGLGTILGARVLAEFGEDSNRYDTAKCRKNYAGTSPITKASGKHRVVLAHYARNRRLADACYLWAFAAITASPGAPGPLRPTPRRRRHPQPCPARAGQPPRRHPPRVPSPPDRLRRTHRLGTPHSTTRRLTLGAVGYLGWRQAAMPSDWGAT